MASARNVSIGVTTLVIGILAGNILSSILSSPTVPVGSTITGGNLVMVTTNKANSSVNANPSIVVNSGAVTTYPTSGARRGGGYPLTASGTRNFVANIPIPITYSSGAYLRAWYIGCGNWTAKSTTGSVVANQYALKQSITTGNQLRNNIFVGTGGLTQANTGAIANTKLTGGTYLSFITNSSGGSAVFGGVNDCAVFPTFAEKYGR